jgi:hypothetical protein
VRYRQRPPEVEALRIEELVEVTVSGKLLKIEDGTTKLATNEMLAGYANPGPGDYWLTPVEPLLAHHGYHLKPRLMRRETFEAQYESKP